jgi:hypothetical protein
VTRILLDHPWPVESTLDDGPAFGVIRAFSNLIGRSELGLQPVRFIDEAEYARAWEAIGQSGRKLAGFAELTSFIRMLVREEKTECAATPNPAPNDLRDPWRRALRGAMEPEDWRSPQIIIASSRGPAWQVTDHQPEREVEIRFDPCENESERRPEDRTLAVLEQYDQHRFAKSDLDPWDLERCYPPTNAQEAQRPCRLPKPSDVGNLTDLGASLKQARRTAKSTPSRYYFIPSDSWSYESVGKVSWRKGGTFSKAKCKDSDRVGYVDFEGLIWVWDRDERHWDVQTTPKHTRVSHTGQIL